MAARYGYHLLARRSFHRDSVSATSQDTWSKVAGISLSQPALGQVFCPYGFAYSGRDVDHAKTREGKGLKVAVPRKATNEWTLWVVAVSCVLHVAEEFFTGWQEWAREALGIAMPSMPFLLANAVLVIAAFLLARVGWRRPSLSLVIPSATLVNAIFF